MRPHPFASGTALVAALGLSISCSRSAPQEPPKPPPPPPLEYLGEWGQRGDAPGRLKAPLGLARDTAGLIYVSDGATGYVQKFDTAAQPLLAFKEDRARRVLEPPRDAGRRQTPYDLAAIAVDRGGAIYVLDPQAARVLLSWPDGKPLYILRVGPGGRLHKRTGIAVDDDGYLYVVDAAAQRISKFNPRGRLMKTWGKPGGGPGEFSRPTKVAVGPDGFLYVADGGSGRVEKFTRDGEFVSEFRREGELPGRRGDLTGLAVSEKYVFAADNGNQHIYVWALDGRFLLASDQRETLLTDSAFPSTETPGDIVLAGKNELLVLNPSNSSILRFRINF